MFCFDLATEYFLRTCWQGTEVYEEDGYRQVMESSYDEASGRSTLVLTGTLRTPAGRARCFREVHVERSFPLEVVDALLRRAGLVPEALYDCFTFQPPGPMSQRYFWVARTGNRGQGTV